MASERLLAALLLCALSVAAGCGSQDASNASSGNVPGPSYGAGAGAPGMSQPGASLGAAGAAPLAPEKELDQSFRAPVATGKVLWTANPQSGRVALIDAQTLAVRMTNAGFGPTYLAALPSKAGTDSAIVINVGSHDASWFVASESAIDVVTIPTHVGANAWSISADGRFAIAWTDATRITGTPDLVNGYSELTVIDLAASPPTSTRLSVGFRPSQVVFDAAARHAFAIVDEGITVLDLGDQPALSALLTVSADGQAAHARDVNIAPDGSFAVVRVDGSAHVEIIDLATNDRQTVALEASVTDLDLSPDGRTATAVLGDAVPPKVVRFAVPNPGSDSAAFDRKAIDGELVRSVTLAPNGQVALLYENAVPSSHLSLLDTGSLAVRTLDLQGAVQGVYVSPDSASAITFQAPPANSKKAGLFSIVPLGAVRAPRIVATDALPAEIAFSEPALGKALITVHDASSAVHGVYVIGLSNLEQNFVALSAEPLPGATGIVPAAKRGFVAQKHPEGRITFIDLETGVAQTLSGFELAARVVQ
jgi:WD40 repeat protein